MATPAPTNAAPVISQSPAAGTRLITRMAPSPAPPVTPRIPGSASGLRQTAWITAPATASAAPATTAASTNKTQLNE